MASVCGSGRKLNLNHDPKSMLTDGRKHTERPNPGPQFAPPDQPTRYAVGWVDCRGCKNVRGGPAMAGKKRFELPQDLSQPPGTVISLPEDYAPHVADPAYPPKNRARTGLGLLAIRLVSADRTAYLDPNLAIMAAINNELPLGKPCVASDISGKPGYKYETCDLSCNLTAGEIERLILLALRPPEFKALRDKFGVFHEIHDDFYDPESGVAFQPKRLDPGPRRRKP